MGLIRDSDSNIKYGVISDYTTELLSKEPWSVVPISKLRKLILDEEVYFVTDIDKNKICRYLSQDDAEELRNKYGLNKKMVLRLYGDYLSLFFNVSEQAYNDSLPICGTMQVTKRKTIEHYLWFWELKNPEIQKCEMRLFGSTYIVEITSATIEYARNNAIFVKYQQQDVPAELKDIWKASNDKYGFEGWWL